MSVYTLSNIDTLGAKGIEIKIAEKGATILSIDVPDRLGVRQSVCLGYNALNDYQTDPYFIGATIGRYPNRIGNSQFFLGEKCIKLKANNGQHQLHGGDKGLHTKTWQLVSTSSQRLHLRSFCADGEAGYPGNVSIDAEFLLNHENELTIEYRASTDQDTLFGMTNHAYWNLAGSGNIFEQQLQLFCEHRLELDQEQIPTGKIVPTRHSDYDFKELRAIKKGNQPFKGFDDYFIKNSDTDLIAYACDTQSGRTLSVRTTELGCQFYTGQHLGSEKENDFEPFAGFCLETHGYPDAPNHSHFPSGIITPDKDYYQKTIYTFGLLV